MKVVINNQLITVQDKDVLGTGGEATVIRWRKQALKLYHTPEGSHVNKLKELITFAPKLPGKVVVPQELVWDEKGKKVIGFTMPALPAGFEPLCRLFQRSYRDSSQIDERCFVQLMLDFQATLQAIHAIGLVVGDLNDANELFNGDEVQFIDVDSYQFGKHLCRVATQDYLDPLLYSVDLTKKQAFSPANDWYSFAVMAFRGLLLVHPYGGTHPGLKQLTARATARVTVFDPAVNYPKMGLNPKLLTDDLAQLFHTIFAQGWRGQFPLNALVQYRDELQKCATCSHWYPHIRSNCPVCAATAAFVMPEMVSVAGFRVEEFLRVNGKIIGWRRLGDTLHCIAHEDGVVALYSKAQGRVTKRRELFKLLPGARYEIGSEFLAVNPAVGSDSLLVIDLSSDKLAGAAQTTTDVYGGQQAVFAASSRYLYRVAGGMLMRGEIKWGQLLERPVMSVNENQTWFAVAPDPAPGQETVLGFSRVFNEYQFFLHNREGRHGVGATPLLPGESLQETQAVFSGEAALLIRRTRLNGETWLRLEIVDKTGKVAHSRRSRTTELGNIQQITGIAFAQTLALLPTDDGILRVDLASGITNLIPATQPHVGDGDALIPHGRGLLVVGQNKIDYIMLS